MTQIPSILRLGFLLLSQSISCSDLDNISDEAQFDERHFAAFKHFGDKAHLLKDLEPKPIPLSWTLNSNLENSFDHNLIAPKPPKPLFDYNQFLSHGPSTSPGVRYTSTPVETYHVTEDVYEPKAIPQVVPTAGKPPLVLGSGSLGVVMLGKGKYALGSGSLGYAQPAVQQQRGINKPNGGGLRVVPPPHFEGNTAFDAVFNDFDFKTLNHFFRQ